MSVVNEYIYLFNKSTIHCILFQDNSFHLYRLLKYFHCLSIKQKNEKI